MRGAERAQDRLAETACGSSITEINEAQDGTQSLAEPFRKEAKFY